jgi:PII-like signaling protein
MARDGVKVTIYINEADEWEHRPLHLEILRILHAEGISGGTVLHGVAGFTSKGDVETTSLVDAGGKLPLVIEFVDTAENADRVMPILKRMVWDRLITVERVEIV